MPIFSIPPPSTPPSVHLLLLLHFFFSESHSSFPSIPIFYVVLTTKPQFSLYVVYVKSYMKDNVVTYFNNLSKIVIDISLMMLYIDIFC